MLNFFRHRESLKKVVFGGILFLTVVGMVIYLIPGVTGVTDDPTLSEIVAEVAGQKIRAFDLQQNVLQMSQVNRIPQEMVGLYTSQILNEMVLEKATVREAERLGLQVTEPEVVGRLRQMPDLFPGGNFVGKEQYEDMVYQRFRTSVAEFERRFRTAILMEKLRSLVTDSVTISPEEVRKTFEQESEKIVLNYAFVDPGDLRKDINPDDATLDAYYQKNKGRYQVPEKRSVKLIWFNPQQLRPTFTIPEAEMKKYYEDRKDSYRIEERVQVSHILRKADGKDATKLAEAKKKAEELLKQLKAGADFAKLAKENSEDPGPAVKGGDLGWIVRKQTVPEFEKAAFSLAPGSLSDPVQTTFGIHILKVLTHEQAALKPYDEVKLQIQNLLQEDRVQTNLPKIADETAAALRRAPSDIENLARKYNGIYMVPPPFSREDLVPGLGQVPGFQSELSTLQKGQAGRAVPVQSGYAVPLLVDVLPSHPGEFAEVKAQVRTDYVEEQAREKAVAKANEMAKLLEKQSKKDLKKAAESMKLKVTTSEPVARESVIPLLGKITEFDPKAFSRQVGEAAGPFRAGTGQVVFQVDSHTAPKDEDFANQKQPIHDRLLAQKRQQVFLVYQDSLKSRLEASRDLRIYRDVLARLTALKGPTS